MVRITASMTTATLPHEKITMPADDEVDFTFELAEREIAFTLSEELYELDAIYGACYLFVDRCYVFLCRPTNSDNKANSDNKQVWVRLRSKEACEPPVLEALAGEFANELLNQQLRLRIGRATMGIREQYMARAFFDNKSSNATIAELLAELDAEELEEVPLEIPVPWETDSQAAPAADAEPTDPPVAATDEHEEANG